MFFHERKAQVEIKRPGCDGLTLPSIEWAFLSVMVV